MEQNIVKYIRIEMLTISSPGQHAFSELIYNWFIGKCIQYEMFLIDAF